MELTHSFADNFDYYTAGYLDLRGLKTNFHNPPHQNDEIAEGVINRASRD